MRGQFFTTTMRTGLLALPIRLGPANTVLADLGTARCSSFCYREDLSPSHGITPCSWEAPGAQQCHMKPENLLLCRSARRGNLSRSFVNALEVGLCHQGLQLYGPGIGKKVTQWFLARLTAHQGRDPVWISFTQLTFSWHGVTLAL